MSTAGHQHTSACQALLEQISDYIDGELEAALCAQLEQHLAGCDNCRLMVDTTRKTVLLFQRQRRQHVDLSPDITHRLWQALENEGCVKAPDT
ncbi:MAG: zf-HC2 domain-containing protein [Chloroflexota bacterium]